MEAVIKSKKNTSAKEHKSFESKALKSSTFRGCIVNKLKWRMSKLQGSLHTPQLLDSKQTIVPLLKPLYNVLCLTHI